MAGHLNANEDTTSIVNTDTTAGTSVAMATMPLLTPPYGYGEIVPLNRTHNLKLSAISSDQRLTPSFCRNINAISVVIGELNIAARDYPIVFVSGPVGFMPVAILGLLDRQNLFVDDSGQWDPLTYIPAYVRRYPFCIARVGDDQTLRNQRVVCVERTCIDPDGSRLFDAQGMPSAQWVEIEQLLQQYEDELDDTSQMCAIFSKLGLFSPFQFQIKQDSNTMLTIQDMHRIDLAAFEALKPASHKALVSKGLMGPIYTHFNSLENFGRLYQRALKSKH